MSTPATATAAPFTPQERARARRLRYTWPTQAARAGDGDLTIAARFWHARQTHHAAASDADQQWDDALGRLERNPRIDHRAVVAIMERAKRAEYQAAADGRSIDGRRADELELKRTIALRDELADKIDRLRATSDPVLTAVNRKLIDTYDAARVVLSLEISQRRAWLAGPAVPSKRSRAGAPSQPWRTKARAELKAARVPAADADELLRLTFGSDAE